MDTLPQYFGAICALAGAVIGAASAAIVTWITQRQETKRRVIASLIESGMKEWEAMFDLLSKPKANSVLPPWAFILALSQYAELLEKAPDMKEDELIRLIAKIDKRTQLISSECQKLDNQKHRLDRYNA